MNVQAQIARRNSSLRFAKILVALTAVLGFAAVARAQQIPSDRVRFAQQFLRALYPELNGKDYALSVETAISYDDLKGQPSILMVDIGAGAKFARLECCLGGVTGGSLPMQLPYPPELGTPPPPPPATPPPALPPDPKKFWDSEGRAHFRQYLHASFAFDQRGHLNGFSAEGPALDHGDGGKGLREFVNAHPDASDADIIMKLKQSGVKYGPNDQQQFTKDLPLKKLEPFMGKLEVQSVSCFPLDERRHELDIWSFWTVRALATRKDGSKAEYEMTFKPWDGDLIDVHLFIDTSTGPAAPKGK
jgi:hypothetical protein